MRVCGLITLAILLLLALAGCEDSTNITTQTPGNGHNGRVVGMVHGIITTQGTSEPVADVRVTYSVSGGTRTTRSDANGNYRIDGLDEGVYSICFFPPDTTYAAWQEMVGVGYDSALTYPSDRDFHLTIARNVTLYRCTAAVTGYVFAHMDEEHTIPAAGAVVEMSGMGGILNAAYRTVCDSNGYYWLGGLPSVGPCFVVSLPWTCGTQTYSSGSQTAVLTPNDIFGAETMTLHPVTTPVTVLTNNFLGGDFPVNDNLVLVFNRPLKDSTLHADFYSAAGFLPSIVTLDSAGITVTVDPSAQLRPSTSYTLVLTGRTLDDLPFNYGPAIFSTEPRLELVATNLWQVDGEIREDVGLEEALYFRFSRAINVDAPENMVRLLRGGNDILVDWGWSADHLQLNVTPVGSLLPSTGYTLVFVACSPIHGDEVNMVLDFQTTSSQTPPTQVTNVALDDTAHFNWNTNHVWISWDTQPEAEVYHVYAWDENHVTDRVNLGAYPAAVFGRQRVNVVLPVEFDWLATDGVQTPFAAHNRVHLAVRALNNTAAAPLSDDVVAFDNVAPGGFTLSQAGTFNNTAGASDTRVNVRFVTAIEYCTETAPTWGFVEAGGDPTWVLPHDAAVWTWDANHCNGTLEVTIPAHRNGAGDRVWITGLEDNSGNVQSTLVERTLF